MFGKDKNNSVNPESMKKGSYTSRFASPNGVTSFLDKTSKSLVTRLPYIAGPGSGWLIWDGYYRIVDAFKRRAQDDRPDLELNQIFAGAGELVLGAIGIGAILALPSLNKNNPNHFDRDDMTGLPAGKRQIGLTDGERIGALGGAGGAIALSWLLSSRKSAKAAAMGIGQPS